MFPGFFSIVKGDVSRNGMRFWVGPHARIIVIIETKDQIRFVNSHRVKKTRRANNI